MWMRSSELMPLTIREFAVVRETPRISAISTAVIRRFAMDVSQSRGSFFEFMSTTLVERFLYSNGRLPARMM